MSLFGIYYPVWDAKDAAYVEQGVTEAWTPIPPAVPPPPPTAETPQPPANSIKLNDYAYDPSFQPTFDTSQVISDERVRVLDMNGQDIGFVYQGQFFFKLGGPQG